MRRTLQAALTLVLACATPASSALPGPVGDEFLAGDRILPQGTARDLECRDEDGNLYRLAETASIFDPSREIRIEREDAFGFPLPSIEIGAGPSLRSLQCAGAGTLLVILEDQDDDLSRLLTFAPDGDKIGDFVTARVYWEGTAYGIHDSAGIYQTYWDYDGHLDHFHGRWLGYDGVQRGPDVELDEPFDVSNDTRQVFVRASGDVLVEWIAYRFVADGPDRDVVQARLVDIDGNPIGERWEMNQLEGASLWWFLDVEEEEDGLFVVYWYSEEQGGRMGRYFSVDPDVVRPDVVTTTTLPPNANWPGFRPGKKFGETPFEYDFTRKPGLVSDGQGTSLATWWKPVPSEDPWEVEDGEDWVIAKSTDLGRHWSETVVDGLWAWSGLALGANGTAILARAVDHGVKFLISRDAGSTWNEEQEIDRGEPEYPMVARTADAALATEGNGRWGVVWSTVDENEETYDDADRTARVFVAFSDDDGATWDDVSQVWSGSNESYAYVRIATDGKGQWVVAAQTERAIRVARSTSWGFTWATYVVDLWPDSIDWWDPMWVDSLSLAHLDGDRWLIVFASNRYEPGAWGADGDIFSIRSVDGGSSWSLPTPVNVYAGSDGATDAEPSLAHSPGGDTMVVWRSHEPLGKRFGTDADILGATSTTNGRTWKWPESVDANAASDASFERMPKLVAGSGGKWLATWTSQGFGSRFDPIDLVVAAGAFHPGDSSVDAAEDCDDGNTVSGDGCDANGTFTGCGNGIVTAGEACDDGNDATNDDCAECRVAGCGDGFWNPDTEECDTAATTYDGACLPTCELATCGDGYKKFDEECDDGNRITGDDCTNDCELPVCGDGDLWTGHEECDDGDDWDGNSCVEGCKQAKCGDGFVWSGEEMCEPGVTVSPHRCGGSCQYLRLCNTNGVPIDAFTAGDALDILRTAVGVTQTCKSAPRCDLDAGGSVTAIDAQMALRMAVGILKGVCAPVQEIHIHVGKSATMGALQISVVFDEELGTLRSASGRTVCTNPFADSISAVGELDPGHARLGFISLAGFSGDVTIDCKFYRMKDKPVLAKDFDVYVEDATGLLGEPLSPAPVVTLLTP